MVGVWAGRCRWDSSVGQSGRTAHLVFAEQARVGGNLIQFWHGWVQRGMPGEESQLSMLGSGWDFETTP